MILRTIFTLSTLLPQSALPPAQEEKAAEPKPTLQQELLQEELDDLRRRMADLERRQAQTTSANPQTVLNPTVTVIGNFLWRNDDKTVHVDNDPNEPRIDDTLNVREIELDFRAAIDPYADAVAILALEAEAPDDYETGVEEFYARIKALPLPGWEEPPLGTQLRIGRIRTEFGTNNILHLHDLPQSNRPMVIREFLGEEGHVANGVSARALLPSPGDSALQLTLQALQGGGIEVAQNSSHPAWLGNLHLFLPVSEEHSIDAALIGFYGINDEDGRDQSRVTSLDLWYRWKPLRQGESNSFLLGTQLFSADHEYPVDSDGDGVFDSHDDQSPFGYTLWGQYQLSRNLYAGARYDRTDFLTNDSTDRRQTHVYLSWYTSEFLRFRLSYEQTSSDLDLEDGLNTFLLEMNVVFGAHPPEPFWVNK